MIRRREFVAGIGAVACWPVVAWGQQKLPILGFMSARSLKSDAGLVAAFLKGLSSVGYIENQNVRIEYRWAEGDYDRLPALAAELVGMRVSVLVGAGGAVSAQTAKAATSSIPIVFMAGADAVQLGLVDSMSRPGGNATGVTVFASELGPKVISVLRELLPSASRIGVLFNSANPASLGTLRNVQASARALGVEILDLDARSEIEIDPAFTRLVAARVDALLVTDDPFFQSKPAAIVTRAARYAVPAIYTRRSWVTGGGLMSYGDSIEDQYFQGGIYAGRVLNGADPASLPVLRSSRFELIINLKTAKALGLTVPPTLLASADEVIE